MFFLRVKTGKYDYTVMCFWTLELERALNQISIIIIIIIIIIITNAWLVICWVAVSPTNRDLK